MSLHSSRWTYFVVLVFWCTGCGSPQPPQPQPSANNPEPETKAVTGGQDQDSDDDGLTDEMEAKLGTSPLHADTDGDGFSDYDEVVEKGFDPANDPVKFNPRIADVPLVDIEISQSPQVYFLYDRSEGKSVSMERGRTTDRGLSTTIGHDLGLSVGYHSSMGTMSGAPMADTGWSVEASYHFNRSVTRESRDSLSEMRSEASDTGKDTRGGEILVGVKLHNRGNVQLDVTSLRLTASKVLADVPDHTIPMGQLELDTPRTFNLIAQILPHKSTDDQLVFKTALNLSQMEELFKDGDLVVRVAEFAFAGMEAFTNINAKTATVVIDPGPGEEGSGDGAKIYHVAVHSPDGARGISADEVLRDVLHLQYETGTSPWKYGDPENPREGQTHSGLRSLLGRANDYASNGYWVVSHTTRVGAQTETVDYSPLQEDCALDDIRLHSGHTLQLTYVQDTDRDELEHRTELMLGTDPRVKDTDEDGLSDGEEVAGWTVTTGAGGLAAPRSVRSDPRQADSDGDGLSDAVEKERQTDPLRRNIKVPSVVKMKREDAIKQLEEAKLTYTVTTREEEKEPAGLVLEQSPRGGDLVEEGAETTLVVSVQSAQVATPSVVGMSADDAIRRLKEAGLGHIITPREDWDNKAGSVLEQSHAPGTKLEKNSQIELWVAKEPPDLWIEFKHSGAYVAKFYLSWEDDQGPQHWESGKNSSGYSEKIWFKRKNTRQIHINAQAMTGLVWQPWGDIWDLKFATPPNATFIAKGTTLHRSYEKKE